MIFTFISLSTPSLAMKRRRLQFTYEVLGSKQHTGIGPSGSDKEPGLGKGRPRGELTNITRWHGLFHREPI